ncbi:RNA polymerase sigma factor [Pleomorphovibrio marinus]|uniref:RNA polymerase sigma factor n=1 Tax=Pleomorphovibrio marinus TaxID=2164132 RepID=UPI000E0AE4B8|nr:sigma-70 family RNA polymerase sigma factor [Pleomorphovibrio marinus]
MRKSILKMYGQQELIEGIRSNDDQILRWLYQSQYPKLEIYILNNNGNVEQAKDIFQEAFVALWKKVKEKGFEPNNGTAITGYLYQIGKNKWLDYLRSAEFRNTIKMETYFDTEEAEEGNYLAEYERQVAIEFQSLRKNCQELLRRFYIEKESMKTLAEFFQWTEATARNNKYRCLQKLREKIKAKIKH